MGYNVLYAENKRLMLAGRGDCGGGVIRRDRHRECPGWEGLQTDRFREANGNSRRSSSAAAFPEMTAKTVALYSALTGQT
jgi:hypothetical protein